jgi:hypothetical protein
MFQVSRQSTADGKIRVALAIEVDPERIGTSGTMPWRLVRFAIAHEGGVSACVTAQDSLQYQGSHHNCSDAATITSGGVTWRVVHPDRSAVEISATGADTIVATPLVVRTCDGGMSGHAGCTSGGPC